MVIQQDCFAVVISTGRLVHVKHKIPGLTIWVTTYGEYYPYELRRVGRDLALPILFDLLDTGSVITRGKDNLWRADDCTSTQ